MSDLRALLDTKLDQAFCEQWDPRRPTRVEVVELGDLVGVRLWAMDRSGQWHLVHDEPPTSLTTRVDVDDLLARSLSILLMEHPRWPK